MPVAIKRKKTMTVAGHGLEGWPRHIQTIQGVRPKMPDCTPWPIADPEGDNRSPDLRGWGAVGTGHLAGPFNFRRLATLQRYRQTIWTGVNAD